MTTSVVAAAPDRNAAPPAHESVAPTREETTGRLSYNDAAAKPAPDVTDPADGWIELASATPASHGREFISIDADAGALTRLRLTAAAGRPGIQAVRVDYVHGGSRTFPIDKTLAAKRAPAYVDLRGPRAIRQIIVISDRDSRGSYLVQGLTGDPGVAMR
ncbi:MAG: hypothetical protein ABIY55_00320 [Kofleriaceae bacterium]